MGRGLRSSARTKKLSSVHKKNKSYTIQKRKTQQSNSSRRKDNQYEINFADDVSCSCNSQNVMSKMSGSSSGSQQQQPDIQYWDQLPDIVLQKVFGHLFNFCGRQQAYVASSVCKRWHQAAFDVAMKDDGISRPVRGQQLSFQAENQATVETHVAQDFVSGNKSSYDIEFETEVQSRLQERQQVQYNPPETSSCLGIIPQQLFWGSIPANIISDLKIKGKQACSATSYLQVLENLRAGALIQKAEQLSNFIQQSQAMLSQPTAGGGSPNQPLVGSSLLQQRSNQYQEQDNTARAKGKDIQVASDVPHNVSGQLMAKDQHLATVGSSRAIQEQAGDRPGPSNNNTSTVLKLSDLNAAMIPNSGDRSAYWITADQIIEQCTLHHRLQRQEITKSTQQAENFRNVKHGYGTRGNAISIGHRQHAKPSPEQQPQNSAKTVSEQTTNNNNHDTQTNITDMQTNNQVQLYNVPVSNSRPTPCQLSGLRPVSRCGPRLGANDTSAEQVGPQLETRQIDRDQNTARDVEGGHMSVDDMDISGQTGVERTEVSIDRREATGTLQRVAPGSNGVQQYCTQNGLRRSARLNRNQGRGEEAGAVGGSVQTQEAGEYVQGSPASQDTNPELQQDQNPTISQRDISILHDYYSVGTRGRTRGGARDGNGPRNRGRLIEINTFSLPILVQNMRNRSMLRQHAPMLDNRALAQAAGHGTPPHPSIVTLSTTTDVETQSLGLAQANPLTPPPVTVMDLQYNVRWHPLLHMLGQQNSTPPRIAPHTHLSTQHTHLTTIRRVTGVPPLTPTRITLLPPRTQRADVALHRASAAAGPVTRAQTRQRNTINMMQPVSIPFISRRQGTGGGSGLRLVSRRTRQVFGRTRQAFGGGLGVGVMRRRVGLVQQEPQAGRGMDGGGQRLSSDDSEWGDEEEGDEEQEEEESDDGDGIRIDVCGYQPCISYVLRPNMTVQATIVTGEGDVAVGGSVYEKFCALLEGRKGRGSAGERVGGMGVQRHAAPVRVGDGNSKFYTNVQNAMCDNSGSMGQLPNQITFNCIYGPFVADIQLVDDLHVDALSNRDASTSSATTDNSRVRQLVVQLRQQSSGDGVRIDNRNPPLTLVEQVLTSISQHIQSSPQEFTDETNGAHASRVQLAPDQVQMLVEGTGQTGDKPLQQDMDNHTYGQFGISVHIPSHATSVYGGGSHSDDSAPGIQQPEPGHMAAQARQFAGPEGGVSIGSGGQHRVPMASGAHLLNEVLVALQRGGGRRAGGEGLGAPEGREERGVDDSEAGSVGRNEQDGVRRSKRIKKQQ